MGRIGVWVGIGVFAVACGDDATVASTESENGTDVTSTGTTEPVDDDVGTTSDIDPTEGEASTQSADATSDEGTDATGTPIGCGDGVTDPAEVCDDGNVEDGDGCGADCSTATCLVPVTHATIQLGVEDQACPTVWVMPGTYPENVAIYRTVVVEGVAIADVIVDGSLLGTVVTVAADDVVLRNLTITNGLAGQGGGIDAMGSLTLENTVVTGNATDSANDGGGGLRMSGEVTLIASTISENTTVSHGGGVFMSRGSILLTDGSSISDNTIVTAQNADVARGAGIYAEGAFVRVDGNSTIASNSITLNGGGTNEAIGGGIASIANGTVEVENATISGNTVTSLVSDPGNSSARGGGIAIDSGTLHLLPGAIVTQNAIEAYGSTVAAEGAGVSVSVVGALVVEGAEISDNDVIVEAYTDGRASGGGVAVVSLATEPMQITDTTIAGNSATADATGATVLASGGGVFVWDAGAVSQTALISRSTIADNELHSDQDSFGGGVAISANDLAELQLFVTNSTISGNSASGVEQAHGGGIAVYDTDGAAEARLVNATITNNVATEGGGIHGGNILGMDVFVVRHSIVYGNVAALGPTCWPGFLPEYTNALGIMTDCAADTTNAVLQDPMLGPLGPNGGPTLTHAIDTLSPAYQAGQASCTASDDAIIPIDQRGVVRPGGCTLGAYEAN